MIEKGREETNKISWQCYNFHEADDMHINLLSLYALKNWGKLKNFFIGIYTAPTYDSMLLNPI